MNQESHPWHWVFISAALVAGLGAGYYYGDVKGVEKGIAEEKA